MQQTPIADEELVEIEARQRVADQILPIIFATNVSRTACLTEPADAIPQLTARRIADNVQAWVASGDWVDRPLTAAEIDDAEQSSVSILAAEVRRQGDEILEGQAEIAKLRDLLAKENKRANAAIDREETAEQTALEAQQERDKLIRWHGEDEAALDKMRDTIVHLRVELAKATAAAPASAVAVSGGEQ
ncbi:hypothetical protein ACWCQZ_41175 [Streptomyces sp. NPDC002285]